MARPPKLPNRTTDGVPINPPEPAGNSNLLARHFHISKAPEALCRMVVEGVSARTPGAANRRSRSWSVRRRLVCASTPDE